MINPYHTRNLIKNFYLARRACSPGYPREHYVFTSGLLGPFAYLSSAQAQRCAESTAGIAASPDGPRRAQVGLGRPIQHSPGSPLGRPGFCQILVKCPDFVQKNFRQIRTKSSKNPDLAMIFPDPGKMAGFRLFLPDRPKSPILGDFGRKPRSTWSKTTRICPKSLGQNPGILPGF